MNKPVISHYKQRDIRKDGTIKYLLMNVRKSGYPEFRLKQPATSLVVNQEDFRSSFRQACKLVQPYLKTSLKTLYQCESVYKKKYLAYFE
ncbi:MAG: hypothetical protein HOM11_00765 [Methylococcales bacterium]|jgi:hypothetical protein|nr:hypothetical protein [Methylococcales bacterium]MBT7445758.1 hypothetical protein [Methylococcales bacterium]